MPTWGELFHRLQGMTTPRWDAYDVVRRESIRSLNEFTRRDVILYAGGHLQKPWAPSLTSIDHSDMQGFMETLHNLKGPDLDLIIHSPGGSVEATEAIGEYLRKRFSYIRAFVPHMAMSAATILSFVADEIVMADHAQLGPIDPQFLLHTSFGFRMVPAQAITEQFERARQVCLDNPDELPVWAEMLQQYGPDLLVEADNASELSAFVVRDWLSRYMFSSLSTRERRRKAGKVADYLANHSTHLTHSRGIFRSDLEALDPALKVVALEHDQTLQDLVLTIYHAATHTFSHTHYAKIIENHLGQGYISRAPVEE